MTNKTPIQELIDYFDGQMHMSRYAMIAETFKSVIEELKEYKQKEKAFAFDCYKSGLESWTWDVTEGICEVGSPTFEEFYYKYAEQHPK